MRGSEGSALGAAGLLTVALALAAGTILSLGWGFGRLVESGALADSSPAMLEGAFTVLLFALLALFAVLGLWLAHRRPVLGDRPARRGGAGLSLGVLGVGIAVGLSSIAGVTRSNPMPTGGALLLVGGTFVTLFQTGVEELYFRGWLQPLLQQRWGRWPGLAASALAFAALHFVAGPIDAMSVLTVTLAGLWFGLLAERSGGLALPIAAHFGWNWSEELLLGVAPNPGTGSFGAIFDLDLIGSPLWGGAEAGLNASLSTALALVALIIVSVDIRRRPDSRRVVSSIAQRG